MNRIRHMRVDLAEQKEAVSDNWGVNMVERRRGRGMTYA